MYNTVLLQVDGVVQTGSFFRFNISNDQGNDNDSGLVIITNKHLIINGAVEGIKDNDKLFSIKKTVFRFHLKGSNGVPDRISPKEEINTQWFFHPDQDLCFCYAKPIFDVINQKINYDVYYFAGEEDWIYNPKTHQNVSVLEDVAMIGYPKAINDEKNYFPVFRKGCTSSHPAVDFDGKSIGLVDVACFMGSSGSPVYARYNAKEASNNTPPILLGFMYDCILFSLRINPNNMEEKCSQSNQNLIPNIPMNLGHYIKARELLYFKDTIQNNW